MAAKTFSIKQSRVLPTLNRSRIKHRIFSNNYIFNDNLKQKKVSKFSSVNVQCTILNKTNH